MKNYLGGFIIPIVIVIVAIVAAGGGAYVYTKNRSGETNVDTTTQATSTAQVSNQNWKTYSNSKYGFSISYPKGFSGLKEYAQGQDCKPREVGGGASISSVQVAEMSNLYITVVCQSPVGFDKTSTISYGEDPRNSQVKSITVAGKAAYEHMFTNGTGYTWNIAKIPLDSSHYVEIAYTYGNSYAMNGDGYLLNGTEWANILASFKITR